MLINFGGALLKVNQSKIYTSKLSQYNIVIIISLILSLFMCYLIISKDDYLLQGIDYVWITGIAFFVLWYISAILFQIIFVNPIKNETCYVSDSASSSAHEFRSAGELRSEKTSDSRSTTRSRIKSSVKTSDYSFDTSNMKKDSASEKTGCSSWSSGINSDMSSKENAYNPAGFSKITKDEFMKEFESQLSYIASKNNDIDTVNDEIIRSFKTLPASSCRSMRLDEIFANSNGMWTCRLCDSINNNSTTNCIVCGSNKE